MGSSSSVLLQSGYYTGCYTSCIISPLHVQHGAHGGAVHGPTQVNHGVVQHLQHAGVQVPPQGSRVVVPHGARQNYKIPNYPTVSNSYLVHNGAGHHVEFTMAKFYKEEVFTLV